MPSKRTTERPSELGLKGERLAKTPTRVFPPRRGGRTVGFQSLWLALWKWKINQRWLKESSSRKASGVR